MNNDRKQANVEVLQKQQEEHKIRAQKIDKLKTAYAQYELGQIDNDQFKYIILSVIKNIILSFRILE